MTQYEDFEADGPRGWSPLAVALIATLVLLLGLGGALFGIRVANINAEAARTPGATLSPPSRTTPPVTPTTPPSTTPPVTTPPATTPPATAFPLPDLAGSDFRAARQTLRELGIGWRLVFEGAGDDATVRATDPAAGIDVKRGDTVKIFVLGAPPPATLPADLVGRPCREAAAVVVDAGLYPRYPMGKKGTVSSIVPLPSEPPTLRWNDEVNLFCG